MPVSRIRCSSWRRCSHTGKFIATSEIRHHSKTNKSTMDYLLYVQHFAYSNPVSSARTLQHPALLQCLAQCSEVTPYLLVMEFCPLVGNNLMINNLFIQSFTNTSLCPLWVQGYLQYSQAHKFILLSPLRAT